MYSIRPPLFQSTIHSSTSEAEELVYICRCSEHFCMKYKVLEMLPIKIFREIIFTKFFVKLISRKKYSLCEYYLFRDRDRCEGSYTILWQN